MVLSNQGPQVLMEVIIENQDETEDGNQDEMKFVTESEASNEEEVHGCYNQFSFYFFSIIDHGP